MCTATITAEAIAVRGCKSPRLTLASLVFAGVLLFVGAVSIYDGYLVVRTGDDILQFEKNPVGVFLIQCDHGDPTLFLMAKAVGTTLVLIATTALYRRSRSMAFSVASALLLFQAGLLIFLERA